MGFWFKSGEQTLVVNSSGQPIDCDNCPCDEGGSTLVDCCPDNAVSNSLTITISGSVCFSGSHTITYTPNFDPSVLNGQPPGTGCASITYQHAWVCYLPVPNGCGCYTSTPQNVVLWVYCDNGTWRIAMCNSQNAGNGGVVNFQSGSAADSAVCNPIDIDFVTDDVGNPYNTTFYCNDGTTTCCGPDTAVFTVTE